MIVPQVNDTEIYNPRVLVMPFPCGLIINEPDIITVPFPHDAFFRLVPELSGYFFSASFFNLADRILCLF